MSYVHTPADLARDDYGDGVSHINVYSRGKTRLGQALTNFAAISFEHPSYGKFASVEGFWYWLATGRRDDRLRTLTGYEAKKVGQELSKNGRVQDPHFEQQIKQAVLLKIEQHAKLAEDLKACTLPLAHYYVYGAPDKPQVVREGSAQWLIDYIGQIRMYLQGRAHKLLIAGSRDIEDPALLRHVYEDAGYEAIEIVSGLARGVDQLAVKYAQYAKIPVKGFPADWDGLGKRAGFVRNAQMGVYCTAALILWDGRSPGTRNMIEIMKRSGKPYTVYRTDTNSMTDYNRSTIKTDKYSYYSETEQEPTSDEFWVFGSNKAGAHGKGTAKIAVEKYGAAYGQGFGLQGRSWAIPTRDYKRENGHPKVWSLTLDEVKANVARFVQYTQENPDKHWYVANVGCGNAGFTPAQMAPLFKGAINCRFPEAWREYLE